MNTDKIGKRRAFSEGILVYCTLPAMVYGELLPSPFFRFALPLPIEPLFHLGRFYCTDAVRYKWREREDE